MVVKEELSHRQRQALATRVTVARAARTLFRERGYVSTTIQAIAEAADIPEQTIYSAFGSKARILDEVRRLWIAEAQTSAMHDKAMASDDPAERLRGMAALSRVQLEGGCDVIVIHQEAARADARMADRWRKVLGAREGALRPVIESIEGALAPGLTVDAALDRYVALTLSEIYQLLVIERGGSADQYETWLGDLLVSQLLA